ncbi:MAG: DctP family TRAP transporter solute-binding subunit [Rhodoferax sp.]|nr:DctP family TRAP transporter solute-binding subunit [Rhodoferax sp.]
MKLWKPLAAALGLCLSVTAYAQNLTLSFGTQLPETHVVYKGILEVKRKLEESSKGSMTLKIFPGAQLGDFKAMVGQTQAGDLDIVMTGYPDMSYIIPELKLIGAPYVISSYEHLRAVVKSPYGQRMDAKFREKGVNLFDVWYEGTRHTTANKPINSMADLKGLKMRTPNVPFLIAYAQAVGATPAPVAFAELYLALQTKQVDAQENPLPTIDAVKIYEVQKHIALTGHFIASSAILVGEKALKKLNPTQKQWLDEAIQAGGKVATAGVMKSEADLIAGFKAKGLTVSTVDTAPFRSAMKSYYDTLDAEFGAGEIGRIMAVK